MRAVTTVVVGGGPTGVETAGALASMAHEVVGPVATLRVILVEAGPRLLNAFSPRSSQRALQDLRRRGVDVRLGRNVEAADPGGVTLVRRADRDQHGDLGRRGAGERARPHARLAAEPGQGGRRSASAGRRPPERVRRR